MFGRKIVCLATALSLLGAMPAESQACFGWFTRPTTVNYAPCVAAPACNTCQPCAQQVNYMPQTCYRTAYVNVPVTSYRPMSSCDPCSGCPTTCMRPVTSYMTQARLVPYTTYRPVYSTTVGYAPAAGCSSCAAGMATTYRPVGAAVAMPAPGCSSCSTAGYAPAATYAPASYAPASYAPAGYAPAGYAPATYAAAGTYPPASTVTAAPRLLGPVQGATTLGAPGSTVPSLSAPAYATQSTIAQPQGAVVSQPQGGYVSQPQGGYVTQPQGGIVAQPQAGYVAQPQGAVISQPQGGIVAQPQTGYVSQPQTQQQPAYQTQGEPNYLSPPASKSNGKTFKDDANGNSSGDADKDEPQSRLKVIPDPDADKNTSNGAQRQAPNDRSAAGPVKRAALIQPISAGRAERLDDSGWHAAH